MVRFMARVLTRARRARAVKATPLVVVLPGAMDRRSDRRAWGLPSAVRLNPSHDVEIITDRQPDRPLSLTAFRDSRPGQGRKAAVSAAIKAWQRRRRSKAYSFATITRVVR